MKLHYLYLLSLVAVASAGQNAAPSSHFVFDDHFEGDIIINEVRVPEGSEAKFTYYEALGWRGKASGYAEIQAHPKAHNYIFSIWDHKAHTAPIKAVHRGSGTLTENFGGEGTGLKSWNFELGWDTDVWYIAKDETGEFYLMTAGGADTKPAAENPSRHAIARAEKKLAYAPLRVASATLRPAGEHGFVATWETDPKTLPQFRYEIHESRSRDPGEKGKILAQGVVPHAREAEFETDRAQRKTVTLRCWDILGNEATPVFLRLGGKS